MMGFHGRVVNMKICKKCKQDKELKEFNKAKNNHQSICKSCKKEYDKNRRLLKYDELKQKSKDYRNNLTKEQKYKINKSKKFVDVTCSVCESIVNKRQDTLKKWSGMCLGCSRKEVSNRPEMIEHYKNNGLDFIERFGFHIKI